MREVVIDVETTGFSPDDGDKIVSIALIEITDFNVVGRSLVFAINPERKIPIEASRVHGIYDDDVLSAPRFGAVARDIFNFIGESCVVGYNVQFDLDFLLYEFEALGAEFPPFKNPAVDVMELVQRIAGGGRRKLHVACQEFGIDISKMKAHSANDDALVTAHLYSRLRSRCSAEKWDRLRRSTGLIFKKEIPERNYEIDALQSAWELFQAKEYDKAVQLVLTVIDSDATCPAANIDPRSYELAAMILRRQNRPDRELDVLLTYFRRAIKADITIAEISRLAEPPPLTLAASNLDENDLPDGYRPTPYVWEMAARVLRVVELGDPVEERLYKALKSIPLPYGYEEAAIALRKIIGDKDKTGDNFSAQLDVLYQLAQQHAFLYEEWFDKGLGYPVHVIVDCIPRDDLKSIQASYSEIGYQLLPLLKKVDVRRLVKERGEPRAHVSMRNKLAERWAIYRKAAHDHLCSRGLLDE